jgi:hypothetical protein
MRFKKRDHFCLCFAVATPELQTYQHTPGLAHGHRSVALAPKIAETTIQEMKENCGS